MSINIFSEETKKAKLQKQLEKLQAPQALTMPLLPVEQLNVNPGAPVPVMANSTGEGLKVQTLKGGMPVEMTMEEETM